MSTLTASIVLHHPAPSLLARTLTTLAQAVEMARRKGCISAATLLLTDHSRHPAGEEEVAGWRRLLAEVMELEYQFANRNPGFGAGHNAAFRRAEKADFFLVANPDLEFAPDSLVAGLGFLAAHPATGVIAPALIEANGVRPACFRYPDLLTLFTRLGGYRWGRARNRRYECRDWDAEQPVFNPPLMSGCCLLFRREAYARLGGFDPRYFLYFEDFDLSWRARRLGLSAYAPAMRVRHYGGGAGRKGWRHRSHFLRSAWRFFADHGWQISEK